MATSISLVNDELNEVKVVYFFPHIPYKRGFVVEYKGVFYSSLVDNNLGSYPGTHKSNWLRLN